MVGVDKMVDLFHKMVMIMILKLVIVVNEDDNEVQVVIKVVSIVSKIDWGIVIEDN